MSRPKPLPPYYRFIQHRPSLRNYRHSQEDAESTYQSKNHMLKKCLILMTLLTSLFIAGCGKSLGGVYEKNPGDKVYMSVMGVKTEVIYLIDSKNLKI